MSASVTFDLPAAKTKNLTLINVDVGTVPTWTIISGASTVTPAPDGLSAAWLGAPAGDVTEVDVDSVRGGAADKKRITAKTYDAGSGGGGGPDVEIGPPA